MRIPGVESRGTKAEWVASWADEMQWKAQSWGIRGLEGICVAWADHDKDESNESEKNHNYPSLGIIIEPQGALSKRQAKLSFTVYRVHNTGLGLGKLRGGGVKKFMKKKTQNRLCCVVAVWGSTIGIFMKQRNPKSTLLAKNTRLHPSGEIIWRVMLGIRNSI